MLPIQQRLSKSTAIGSLSRQEKKERCILEVFEAVRTVLAVRQFRDEPIPTDVVREIVEAGHLTASAGNQQPWHFIVVQDKETLHKLGELATHGPYIAQAPLAIVVAGEKTPFAVSDASRAIQDQILTAWSHGVGSNWVGFSNLPQVKPVLGIPDNIDVIAIVPFGYPAKKVGKGNKKRKPLGEVVHNEHWGQPFA
jgi:nitroreductase